MQKIAMLGSGFIGRFYAEAIHGQRGRDRVIAIYARSEANAKKFAADYDCAYWSTEMEKIISNPEVTMVCIALPNNKHEEAVRMCAQYHKNVVCTKPLGRNAEEAYSMMELAEHAGIFAGYLEDLCYTPKFIKALAMVKNGSLGRILWAKSRETHPGPHSDWFWDKEQAGGGCMLDLGCHCVEIARNYIGKDIRPVRAFCWAATQAKPIEAEDHAIALIEYENGAIGQFETSWSFRGGMDLRDEVMGTEGTIWINSFLRTGFEAYTSGKGGDYISEKAESNSGWLFPVGDEVNELGYNHMFTDMFTAAEQGRAPEETFYDGYVVNAILDACYKSAESGKWEPIELKIWKGQTGLQKISGYQDYDNEHYFIKEEVTHDGRHKIILKQKAGGKIIERDI